MVKRIVWLMLVLFSFTFYAPAFAQDSDYVVADKVDESVYKLAPGDKVEANMIVGENALSMNYVFTIGPDGKVFFPNVGEINLSGKTIPEAKKIVDAKIRTVYKENYVFSFRLNQPRKVQIYLTGSEDKPLFMGEKKYVSIYGEVAKAGRFEYIPNKKFSDYISFAGGPTPRANLSSSSVSRKDKKIGVNGSAVIFDGKDETDIEIEPGDVINVPAQFFYFTDFGSFSSMLLTFVALYNTFVKR